MKLAYDGHQWLQLNDKGEVIARLTSSEKAQLIRDNANHWVQTHTEFIRQLGIDPQQFEESVRTATIHGMKIAGKSVTEYLDYLANQPILDANHTKHLMELAGYAGNISSPSEVYQPLIHSIGHITQGLDAMMIQDPYLWYGVAATYIGVVRHLILTGGLQ